MSVAPEVVLEVLAGARETLQAGDDLQARRAVLRQFVDRVEVENERGTLWYTFPLELVMPPDTFLFCTPNGMGNKNVSLELCW